MYRTLNRFERSQFSQFTYVKEMNLQATSKTLQFCITVRPIAFANDIYILSAVVQYKFSLKLRHQLASQPLLHEYIHAF